MDTSLNAQTNHDNGAGMGVMDDDLYRHLMEWSMGGFAPGGYTPAELRETVRDWLSSLPADEREEELGLRTWTQMFDIARREGFLFAEARAIEPDINIHKLTCDTPDCINNGLSFTHPGFMAYCSSCGHYLVPLS
jgi:ribosomal protein S27E